jgi:hypothetical protein
MPSSGVWEECSDFADLAVGNPALVRNNNMRDRYACNRNESPKMPLMAELNVSLTLFRGASVYVS